MRQRPTISTNFVRNSYTWRAGIIKSNLRATTRHVLLTLSCHFNDAGEACYPSTKLLAKETGLSERSVITHLTSARELGWLRVSKHGFAGQKWARNQYLPCFPEGTELGSAQLRKGTELGSAPLGKGTEQDSVPPAEGTESRIAKALKDVQSNYSVDLLTTHHPVVAEEIDELVEAAVWAAGGTIRNPSGFRAKVRARLCNDGANPEDLLTLETWRKHIDACRTNEQRTNLRPNIVLDPEAQARGKRLLSDNLRAKVPEICDRE